MMAATVTGAPNASQVLQTVAGLPPPVPSFPALQPVESRQQYRERPETETEEVRMSVTFAAVHHHSPQQQATQQVWDAM